MYSQVYHTCNKRDFSIGKYIELICLYIDYVKQIDQILLATLLFKDYKDLIELEHFALNTYFSTSMTLDYDLNN